MISSIAIYCFNGFNYSNWSNFSIWLIDETLTGITNTDLSGHGSNTNEGVIHILQSFRTEASLSDAVYSYIQDTHYGDCVLPSAEMHLVTSTAPISSRQSFSRKQNHHHHVMLTDRTSVTLLHLSLSLSLSLSLLLLLLHSLYPSESSFTPGRFYTLNPVSAHSCCSKGR